MLCEHSRRTRHASAAWLFSLLAASFILAPSSVTYGASTPQPKVDLGPPGRIDVTIPRAWLNQQLERELSKHPLTLASMNIDSSFTILNLRYREGRVHPKIPKATLTSKGSNKILIDLPFEVVHNRQRLHVKVDTRGVHHNWRANGQKTTVTGRARGHVSWRRQGNDLVITHHLKQLKDLKPHVGGPLKLARFSTEIDVRGTRQISLTKVMKKTSMQSDDLDRLEVASITPHQIVLHLFLKETE
ncbi:MAG: hypothetical protein AAF449_07570 [Myxococcota bacterium]